MEERKWKIREAWPIIIIVDGQGAKPGAIQWLGKAAAGKIHTSPANRTKNIMVMSLAEFVKWANLTFRNK